MYLAAALCALGRTYVQAVAPVLPGVPERGLGRVWSRLRSVVGAEVPVVGVPGCVGDALRSFGRAGIGANHLCDPAVVGVTAPSAADAFVAGLAAEGSVRPDVLCVAEDAAAPALSAAGGSSLPRQLLELGIPVIVAPPGYPGSPTGIRRVTCTFDGSEQGRRALRKATDLALALDAEVRVGTSAPPPVEDAQTLVALEPVSSPLLDEACALVNEWSDWDVIVTPDGDWSMKNEESTAAARWLPEEILVFGHQPEGEMAAQWATACRRFSIPYVLVR